MTQLEDSDTEPEDNSNITFKSNLYSISKTSKVESMETITDDENETFLIPSKPPSQKIEEADSEEEEIKIPTPVKRNFSSSSNNNSPAITSEPSSVKKRLVKGSMKKREELKSKLQKYKIEDDDNYDDEESDTDDDDDDLKGLVVPEKDDDDDGRVSEDIDEEEILSISPKKKYNYSTPKRNTKSNKNINTTPSSSTNKKSPRSPSNYSSDNNTSNFTSPITERGSTKSTFTNGDHEHNSYKWLNEDLKDKYGNKPTDTNYDCHTLKVPNDYLNKQTPGLQQWWRLKTDYFDTILFFKVYNLYLYFI